MVIQILGAIFQERTNSIVLGPKMKRAWSSKLFVTERVWYLAACHSKVNKQVRLVERKVCFISDASMWGEGKGRCLAKG